MAFTLFLGLFLFGFLFFFRIFTVLKSVGKISQKRRPRDPISTLLVLGSGGHTAEILNLVGSLNLDHYWPRVYIAAKTDNMSLQRAQTLEEKLASQKDSLKEDSLKEDSLKGDSLKDSQSKNDETQYGQRKESSSSSSSSSSEGPETTRDEKVRNRGVRNKKVQNEQVRNEKVRNGKVRYLKVFRSREVGQSYLSSIGTTLIAIAHAAFLVFQIRPELILCNGPGTCLPICVSGFLLRVLGVKTVKIIYVESVARVEKLSLTGILLHKMGIVDQFFVQWPQLVDKYPRTQYVGRLM